MTKPAALAFALVILVGCGSDDGDDGDDTPAIDGPLGGDGPTADGSTAPDSSAGTFTLTSPAFAQGGVIPDEHSCMGANTSPQLIWTPGPAGTMSYAVILTDESNDLVHWVIYDIPSAATGLPANVEKAYQPNNVPDAHQTRAYNPGTTGYLGPCPGSMHTYRFDVIALDVTVLPGATMTTGAMQGAGLVGMHDIATASLTGTFTP